MHGVGVMVTARQQQEKDNCKWNDDVPGVYHLSKMFELDSHAILTKKRRNPHANLTLSAPSFVPIKSKLDFYFLRD
jgi:hypothetical protein